MASSPPNILNLNSLFYNTHCNSRYAWSSCTARGSVLSCGARLSSSTVYSRRSRWSLDPHKDWANNFIIYRNIKKLKSIYIESLKFDVLHDKLILQYIINYKQKIFTELQYFLLTYHIKVGFRSSI